MTKRLLGTCSLCGGDVTVPATWHGVFPPTAECTKCGAIPANSKPTVEMVPNPGANRKTWCWVKLWT